MKAKRALETFPSRLLLWNKNKPRKVIELLLFGSFFKTCMQCRDQLSPVSGDYTGQPQPAGARAPL